MDTKRIGALDGVRGIAILLVLANHAGTHLPQPPGTVLSYAALLNSFSWSGVDLFFILSGFLIGGRLIDTRDSDCYFSRFYVRRACRILPLYLLAVALIGMLHIAGFGNDSGVMPTPYYLTFTQNIWAAIGWKLDFPQSWSLAVEEQFYLTLPAIIAFVPRAWLVAILVALATAAPLARSVVAITTGPSVFTASAVYVLFPFRMDSLVLGVLAAVAARNKSAWQWLNEHTLMVYLAASILLACICTMIVRRYNLASPETLIGGYTIIDSFYALLVLLALCDGPAKTVCNFRWLRACGMWAYGIYVCHLAIIDAVLRMAGTGHIVGDRRGVLALIAALLGSIVFGALSWRYIESPFVRFGHRWQSPLVSVTVRKRDGRDALGDKRDISARL